MSDAAVNGSTGASDWGMEVAVEHLFILSSSAALTSINCVLEKPYKIFWSIVVLLMIMGHKIVFQDKSRSWINVDSQN
jgi:hypothetical protein